MEKRVIKIAAFCSTLIAHHHHNADSTPKYLTIHTMSTHKALAIHTLGQPPKFIERLTPAPKDDEILLKVSIVGCKDLRYPFPVDMC